MAEGVSIEGEVNDDEGVAQERRHEVGGARRKELARKTLRPW
jgi:hypothetical protein